MAFLTLLDDRLKPKGSRDPLGFEMVWTHLGRKVVGNLTTITSSMDNFAVAVLGFYLAEKLSKGAEATLRHKTIRENFLRYEQLTGYLRYLAKANDILGITRIKERIDTKQALTLGLNTEQQILSDQASYGLWGLYSSAARDSGLVEGQDRIVTDLGMRVVQFILGGLGEHQHKIHALLMERKPLDIAQLNALSGPFIRALRQQAVQDLLLDVLMKGPQDHQLQKAFWHQVHELMENSATAPTDVAGLIEAVLAQQTNQPLSKALMDIRNTEPLLVAANDLFNYCRRKDGAHLDDVTQWLKQNRNYQHLSPALAEDPELPRRASLAQILMHLQQGEIRQAVIDVIRLNQEVMQQRGGAAWVELERGDTLRVRVKNEASQVFDMDKLIHHWDYDYFIGSFLNVARQYRERQHG